MKQIRIVEQTPGFAQSLAHMLMDGGAVQTSDPNVFEAEDDIADQLATTYHGIRLELVGNVSFMAAKENQEVIAWLNNYEGTFEFYNSLKQQLETRQTLSPKQVDAVRRAIARDSNQKQVSAKPTVVENDLTGKVIIVTKKFAKEIAAKAGLAHPHYAMEVLSVEAETAKAYKLNVRMTAFKTGRCSCCGLTLTDPQSVAIGIGPECADKRGIPHGDLSIELLEGQLSATQTVNTWIPKYAIKEKHEGSGK